MKISRISGYQIDAPIDPFPISGGRETSHFGETPVQIETTPQAAQAHASRRG